MSAVVSTTPKDPPEVLARFNLALPLAKAIMRQLRRAFSLPRPEEELLSYAQEGLLLAARSYDPSLGTVFDAYAAPRIRGRMIDGLRKEGALPSRLYREIRAFQNAGYVEAELLEDTAGRPSGAAGEANSRWEAMIRNMASAIAVGLLPAVPILQDADEADDGTLQSASPDDLSPEDRVAEKEAFERLRGAIRRAARPAAQAHPTRLHGGLGDRGSR